MENPMIHDSIWFDPLNDLPYDFDFLNIGLNY